VRVRVTGSAGKAGNIDGNHRRRHIVAGGLCTDRRKLLMERLLKAAGRAVVAVMVVLLGCAGGDAKTDGTSGASMDYKKERRMEVRQPVKTGLKVLVVYTSQGGNTRRVAEDVAALLGADVERVVDKKKRSGFFGFIVSGRDALSKKLTEIEPVQKDPAQYDLVVLGTPVWAGNITPAMRTYLQQYAGRLPKRVALFATAAGSAGDGFFKAFAETANVRPTATLTVLKKHFSEKLTEEYDALVQEFARQCAEVSR